MNGQTAARQLADLERRANLEHQGITRVLDFGEVDDWLYAHRGEAGGAATARDDQRGGGEPRGYAAEQGVRIGAEPDTVFITGQGRITLSGIPGAPLRSGGLVVCRGRSIIGGACGEV